MPVLEVCPDNEIIAAEAQRGHRCDVCKERRGRSWFGLLWLCARCREIKTEELERYR